MFLAFKNSIVSHLHESKWCYVFLSMSSLKNSDFVDSEEICIALEAQDQVPKSVFLTHSLKMSSLKDLHRLHLNAILYQYMKVTEKYIKFN